jgi:hypothetical protein
MIEIVGFALSRRRLGAEDFLLRWSIWTHEGMVAGVWLPDFNMGIQRAAI